MVFPLLNACNGGTSTPEPDPAPGDNGSTDTRISISASIDARTKAPQLGGDGSGSFAAGDIFTLHLANRVPQSTTYDYKVGETSLFWEDLPLASDDGLVEDARHFPLSMSSSDTFTDDDPISIPRLFILSVVFCFPVSVALVCQKEEFQSLF